VAGLKVILKHSVLRPALETAWRLGLIDLMGRKWLAGRVAVLMYHRLVPDEGIPPDDPDRYNPMTATLTVSRFVDQMRWLARRATVIGLGDVAGIMLHGRRPPRNAVLITFDDGWRDTYELAAPILDDLGLRATVFVSVEAVAERRPLLVDELTWLLQHPDLSLDRDDTPEEVRRLGRGLDLGRPETIHQAVTEATWWLKNLDPGYQRTILGHLRAAVPDGRDYYDRLYLTWDRLGQLAARGWDVGSHGLGHPNLNVLAHNDLDRELGRSREVLVERLGRPMDAFCYPYGDFDARVGAAVARAGYGLAFSTRPGPAGPEDDPLALPRISTGGPKLASFAAKVYGLRR